MKKTQQCESDKQLWDIIAEDLGSQKEKNSFRENGRQKLCTHFLGLHEPCNIARGVSLHTLFPCRFLSSFAFVLNSSTLYACRLDILARQKVRFQVNHNGFVLAHWGRYEIGAGSRGQRAHEIRCTPSIVVLHIRSSRRVAGSANALIVSGAVLNFTPSTVSDHATIFQAAWNCWSTWAILETARN